MREPPDESEPAEPEARVDDCARMGGGVPLARLVTADPFSLATDGESLFYIASGGVMSLPLAGGEPRSLTAKGLGRGVQYADGFVYWLEEGTVVRVPKSGGEPEALVELDDSAHWAVAGDAILSVGGGAEPSPVFRSSLTTGETTEIVPLDESEPVRSIRVVGDRVLVSTDARLRSFSVLGGDEQLLADGALSGVEAPVAFDGDVYFGAGASSDPYLARVSSDEPAAPERLAAGYVVSLAADDDAVYASVIPASEKETPGELVRVPRDGGAAQRLSEMPTLAYGGYLVGSAGLVVDDANVYFIDACTGDPLPSEHRLVAIPKQP